MKIWSRILKILTIGGVFILGGCQTNDSAIAAALDSTDDQTMAMLTSVLAGAMGVASVEIGPGDLTKTSTIAVLPPRLSPLEDRSVVKPTLFDIMLEGGRCYVVRRETGDEYDLDGVSCHAFNG